jgi:hypothetical protein
MSSRRKLFAPLDVRYAGTVSSTAERDRVSSAPLTCFLSSLRRFISAVFSSLVILTRLGCAVFAAIRCDAGGVAVGDRLGTDCLRGVIARRGTPVNRFVQAHRLTAGPEITHRRPALAMAPLQAVPRKSRVPRQVQLQMHLNRRSAYADLRGQEAISLQSSWSALTSMRSSLPHGLDVSTSASAAHSAA